MDTCDWLLLLAHWGSRTCQLIPSQICNQNSASFHSSNRSSVSRSKMIVTDFIFTELSLSSLTSVFISLWHTTVWNGFKRAIYKSEISFKINATTAISMILHISYFKTDCVCGIENIFYFPLLVVAFLRCIRGDLNRIESYWRKYICIRNWSMHSTRLRPGFHLKNIEMPRPADVDHWMNTNEMMIYECTCTHFVIVKISKYANGCIVFMNG